MEDVEWVRLEDHWHWSNDYRSLLEIEIEKNASSNKLHTLTDVQAFNICQIMLYLAFPWSCIQAFQLSTCNNKYWLWLFKSLLSNKEWHWSNVHIIVRQTIITSISFCRKHKCSPAVTIWGGSESWLMLMDWKHSDHIYTGIRDQVLMFYEYQVLSL